MFSDPALAAVLSLKTLSIVWLGGFLGGMATGAAGFAYGIVATSIWLHAIAPLHAAVLVVAGGLIIQSSLVLKMRRALDWPRLAPFVIAGLFGVPIGVALVVKTDAGTIRFAIAIFLVVYGLYAIFAPRLPHVSGGGPQLTPWSAFSAASSAASADFPACCPRSGRSCAAGRKTWRAASISRSSWSRTLRRCC